MEFKDIIQEKEMEDGFVLFQTDGGFFLGVRINNKIEYVQMIDKTAFNCMMKREGKSP